jgi:hypothetical protein
MYVLKKKRKKLKKSKLSKRQLREQDFLPLRGITGNGQAIADVITQFNIEAGFPVPALPAKK